jgi:hypothetical protein
LNFAQDSRPSSLKKHKSQTRYTEFPDFMKTKTLAAILALAITAGA